MSIAYSEKVNKRTVLDGQGQIVGTVEDLLLDPTSMQLAGLRLRLRRDVAKGIGAESGMFQPAVVDVPIAAVRALGGDAVILSIPSAELHGGSTAEREVQAQSEVGNGRASVE